ncbi:hypothetical protein HNR42_001337 [Deinobacterium chartae]|uniref:Lipoprotein n=1 Tax=Deinobacterium chartae TaxID=521158 RepID=A0A841HZ14_9DEIO|nr:hypothetical protein [Deinobacterium chartae]MBB6097914.1 hypothetical protein [Deinobacterium chartae]
MRKFSLLLGLSLVLAACAPTQRVVGNITANPEATLTRTAEGLTLENRAASVLEEPILYLRGAGLKVAGLPCQPIRLGQWCRLPDLAARARLEVRIKGQVQVGYVTSTWGLTLGHVFTLYTTMSRSVLA